MGRVDKYAMASSVLPATWMMKKRGCTARLTATRWVVNLPQRRRGIGAIVARSDVLCLVMEVFRLENDGLLLEFVGS